MENQSTELAQRPTALVVHNDGPLSMFFDTAKFEHGQRVSNMLAASSQVPDAFRGKPADCFVMMQLADQLDMNPLMLMQKCYVVHGKPGMEAQLVIALMNQNGPFEGPVQWKFKGEGMDKECTAYATHKDTKEVCEMTVTMKMAKAEGWIDKSGSKWKTMPDLMLKYRSATYLCNTTCPEVKFGFTTLEEIHDMDIPLPPKQVENVAASVEARLKDIPIEKVIPDMPSFPTKDEVVEAVLSPKDEPEKKKRTPAKKKKKVEPKVQDPVDLAGKEDIVAHKDPGILPEERFYCPDCEHLDSQSGVTPDGKLKCIKCLANNVVDRTSAAAG